MMARGPVFGGLMSGTSLDGVDAILLEVRGDDPARIDWKVIGFRSEAYSPTERARLRDAIERGDAQALTRIHAQLARAFSRAFQALLDECGTEPSQLAAVGSHGQTIWHDPPSAGQPGATLQLGDPAALAEELNCAVVADFRSRDMAAGGHGAPLVPWADWALLRRDGVGRALQNIGGMGNVTFLPADGNPGGVLGFDTGPGVALLDRAAQLASGGTEAIDVDGRRAARGTVNEDLLSHLLEDDFFAEVPPRSTGRERFGDRLVQQIVEERQPRKETDWNDILATLVELTARSAELAYDRFLPEGAVDEVVVSGGGAHNPTLVRALERRLAPLEVATGQEALGIDPDAREAAAFALLAWAHLRGIPGNLPAVTGASGTRVLGALYPGPSDDGTR